jgi:aminopeptidase-like protein
MPFNVTELDADFSRLGEEMHRFAAQMYPVCRSITGPGVRETLQMVQQKLPSLGIHQVESGTQVFDWRVPREWSIREAFIKNSRGDTIIDFKDHNLHVVNYSIPVNATLSLGELQKHLHTIEDQPDAIPYRTSYYHDTWGFCMAHSQFEALVEDDYQVYIDSSLESGVLNYGEFFLAGESSEEIVFYTHICHPSLCNDNLSGISVLTHLAQLLSQQRLRYSYRFVFAPGTIGSISWLSLNQERLGAIRHGLVVALVGDDGELRYKRNRNPDSHIDKVVLKALQDGGEGHEILEFSPYGYDERQFCSPGINLDFGRLTRTPNGCYPEYHTSDDNLDFIHADKLSGSLQTVLRSIGILENDAIYRNTAPYCEPQLGKRGLYDKTGGGKDVHQRSFAMLWVLNQSDGEHSLLDISVRSGLSFELIHAVTQELVASGLLTIEN